MKATRSTWRLTLSVLLLLGPTISVGWIGLREISRLEEEVANSISRSIDTQLQTAAQEFRDRLRRQISVCLTSLDGTSGERMRTALREMADAPPAGAVLGSTVAAFLVAANGQAVYPRLPQRTRNPEPALPPASGSSPRAPTERLLTAIQEAERYAMLGEHTHALENLEAFASRRAIARGHGSANARLQYEIGRFRMRAGRFQGARQSFENAITRAKPIAAQQPGRSGMQALYLLCLIGFAEATERLAAGGSDDGGREAREERARRIVDLLESIASGDFDAIDDDWLSGMYDRVESLAQPYAELDPELWFTISQLRAQNEERIALRLAAAKVRLNKPLPSDSPPGTLKTIPLQELDGTSLLVFSPAPAYSSGLRQTWTCMQIDLGALYAQLDATIEARLSRSGQDYRIELLDAWGRSVETGLDLDDSDEALERTARRALGAPLQTFTIAAIPRDPKQLMSEARHGVFVKGLLLVALAVMAGGGAFLLVRTVRREADLARMKTDFVGRVSHELKTPLALIRMYGETLALGRVQDPERVASFASIIAKESDRLTGMIDNVLDFSRIEAGTKVYVPVPTRLDQHLATVLRSYMPHLEQHGFELRWTGLPEATAEVDPEGLTQALVNLLGNAQKYAASGPKEIDVRLVLGDAEASIEVLDRGPGVPEHESGQIFQRFYRASTAGEQRGAGLGLALVRHFAEHHGGRAEYQERKDGGSIFRIVLPTTEVQG